MPSLQNIQQKEREEYSFVFNKNLVEDFKDIFEEFIIYRGIKRTKGIIYGLEECLKSNEIFEKFSQHLEINVYDPYKIIKNLKNKNLENQPYLLDIVQQLNQYQEEQIDILFEEMQEKQQKNKKKNKEEITREDIQFDAFQNPSDQIIIKVLIYYLKQPLQVFKGYILRNFPKDNNQAHEFITALQEQNLRDDFDFIIKIVPDTELMQESLKNHQKFGQKDHNMQLTEEQINFYERFMNWQDSSEMLTQYLAENQYQIKQIKFKSMKLDVQKMIDNLFNEEFIFQDNQFEIQQQQEEQQQSQQQISQQEIQSQQQKTPLQSKKSLPKSELEIKEQQQLVEDNKENIQQQQQESMKDYLEASKKIELQRLIIQQEKLLQEKTTALKQYLADIILPDVTEGIIEVCKEKPEDPIKFLIQFLKEKEKS